MEILLHQYELVKERRQTLFDYCETFELPHLTAPQETFGGGSIRNLLVHSAQTYFYWLSNFPRLREMKFAKNETFADVLSIRKLYDDVDEVVSIFLRQFDQSLEIPITGKIASQDLAIAITPLQLFTHVLTHESHHKGQILSISRQLGYTPVDTDIIRFQ